MARQTPGFMFSLEAAADLSVAATNQYRALVVDSNGRAAVAGASNVPIVGVLQNDPIQFQAAQIMVDGLSKIKLGGTVAAGDEVMSDASGDFIVAATAGNRKVGICVEGGGSGDIGSAILVAAGATVPV